MIELTISTKPDNKKMKIPGGSFSSPTWNQIDIEDVRILILNNRPDPVYVRLHCRRLKRKPKTLQQVLDKLLGESGQI